MSQLYNKGFFNIDPIPDNRRCLAITLTEAGRSIQKEIAKAIERCEKDSLSHLGQSEREILYSSLQNSIRLLQNQITK